VARLWVDNTDYQSNTVMLGELFLIGWRSEMKPTIPSTKNSEIVKKSEFFYALMARFCSLLYCFVWLGYSFITLSL
jgi:hypothetical protein